MLKLSDIQILKLGTMLHHIKNNNFFYGQVFNSDRITSYDELTTLPFLTYKMLVQGYPFAYSCADTTTLLAGRVQKVDKDPIMSLHTNNDIAHIAEMTARAFSIAGIMESDTILLISDESQCTAYVNTSEKLRHFLIHSGTSNHKHIYQMISDTDATCLVGDTSDLITFVENCRKSSLELTELGLRSGVFCGKPLTNGTRKHIEKETDMEIFQTSGFGDFLTGMASDCKMHDGMHIWDDHYLAEIIDPETDKPVEDGEEGELVVTTLTLTALPLIRFRTGKKTKIISREKCECGLQTPKIAYTY